MSRVHTGLPQRNSEHAAGLARKCSDGEVWPRGSRPWHVGMPVGSAPLSIREMRIKTAARCQESERPGERQRPRQTLARRRGSRVARTGPVMGTRRSQRGDRLALSLKTHRAATISPPNCTSQDFSQRNYNVTPPESVRVSIFGHSRWRHAAGARQRGQEEERGPDAALPAEGGRLRGLLRGRTLEATHVQKRPAASFCGVAGGASGWRRLACPHRGGGGDETPPCWAW